MDKLNLLLRKVVRSLSIVEQVIHPTDGDSISAYIDDALEIVETMSHRIGILHICIDTTTSRNQVIYFITNMELRKTFRGLLRNTKIKVRILPSLSLT